MFWRQKKPWPWEEIGEAMGRKLLPQTDKLSNTIREAFEDAPSSPQDVENFAGRRWRLELTTFLMFWVWYIATSPKLREAGATERLFGTYRRVCRESLIGAGLVEASADEIRRWESGLAERFDAYKEAYESRVTEKAPVLFTGTVGWVFGRYLRHGGEGDPRLAILINELGSADFVGLAEMMKNLERTYGRL